MRRTGRPRPSHEGRSALRPPTAASTPPRARAVLAGALLVLAVAGAPTVATASASAAPAVEAPTTADAPTPVTAAEGDDVDAFGLSATVGLGGHDVDGVWRPVTVTLAPRVPVRGQLVLAADRGGSTLVTTRPVEVAAGTTQRHHLLLPPGARAEVRVVDEASGRSAGLTPATETAPGFLVAVLGSLDPTIVPAVTSPTTDQRATVVAVDDDVLDLGARALDSVGTLVATEADLLALPDGHRAAVTQAVADGAGLVVLGTTRPDLGLPWQAAVDVADGAVDPAPGAWGASLAAMAARPGTTADEADGRSAPTDVAAVAAGRGRLTVTTGTPATGPLASPEPWEHLAQPATDAARHHDRAAEDLPARVEQAFGPVVGEPPSLGWLAGFFAVYVLVVGPVLGIVLSRRRRPELAWVVLPVVVALFAGAAVVGASGSRPRVGATAEVARWADGVGSTLTVAGVRAPQAGDHTIALPGTGWDVATASWSGATRVTTGDDATRLTLSLPGQSFGSVVAERPRPEPAPLDVEVALFDGEARVEVTNTGDRPLQDPVLRLATTTHALDLDVLAPGDTHVQSVPLRDGLPRHRDPFGDVIVERGFVEPGFETGPADLTRLLSWGVLDGAPGTAWITGTTDTGLGHGAQEVDGTTPVDRGALVAVGVTPSVTDDATLPYEVARDLVAVDTGAWIDAPLLLSGAGPATMRFRLPAEGPIDRLTLDLDAGPAVPLAQPVPAERCGQAQLLDEETGDVVEAFRACGVDEAMCPPGAVSCEWGPEDGDVVEGRACFDDGTCRQVHWEASPRPVPDDVGPGGLVAGGVGMELWDHQARRWVPAGEAAPGGSTDAPRPWVGPLGDVWVRATGELAPFDVAVQGVGAVLQGGGA